jgi:hypothetical protein
MRESSVITPNQRERERPMGYRSTIAIAVEAPHVPSLENILREHDVLQHADVLNHNDRLWLEEGDKVYILENVKWYQSIQWVSDIVAWMHEPDKEECYKFCRKGDDVGDVEEIGWVFPDLYVYSQFAGIND